MTNCDQSNIIFLYTHHCHLFYYISIAITHITTCCLSLLIPNKRTPLCHTINFKYMYYRFIMCTSFLNNSLDSPIKSFHLPIYPRHSKHCKIHLNSNGIQIDVRTKLMATKMQQGHYQSMATETIYWIFFNLLFYQ